ncbi:hypothetical protein MSHOH_2658 [Methanosarcina horonobensis HB-1 = JCM 15518]|uniref:Uncharacterized protein n=1 Tax=Methanosarcina horonobensis HB-1 = JCM 15518 TaxID=1434110 RepID=A0A0E3SE19_9EURY|nr:hypothetical protein [Methanosarcina horonobensis]AKB79141.1 hypothetical protein MSHOH_2658 [Methanosarcina horonobensis HB-1 = JCM 15518]
MIAANSADAVPQGTVIKEGVLTYPAGPYLTEDPLLLSLEDYGDDNSTKASGNFSNTTWPENETLCFNKSSDSFISGNPDAGVLWICPSNLFSVYYDCNTEILQPGFAFLYCSTPLLLI